MLKRLWLIFGPVFIAGLLVLLLIFFYPSTRSHNLTEEKYSAASVSAESFKERSQKVRALTDPDMRFVPFFGSSEWMRFDSMHPAVLAESMTVLIVLTLWGRQEQPHSVSILGYNKLHPSLKISKQSLSFPHSGLQKRIMTRLFSKPTLTMIS